jgi:hypothetical protein
MARDHKHYAARVTHLCAGDDSGSVSNTFMFRFTGAGVPSSTNLDDLATQAIAMYNTGPGTNPALGALLGPQFPRVANTSEVAIYDLDLADPAHAYGSPVNVRFFTLAGAAGGTPLPNECAVVLSFRAAYGTDPEHAGTTRPRASDRGRVYLGPWGTSQILAVTPPTGGSVATVAVAAKNTIIGAYRAMVAASLTTLWEASVWSRKEQLFKPVAQYAYDDLWDTQRRRSSADPLHTWLPV